MCVNIGGMTNKYLVISRCFRILPGIVFCIYYVIQFDICHINFILKEVWKKDRQWLDLMRHHNNITSYRSLFLLWQLNQIRGYILPLKSGKNALAFITHLIDKCSKKCNLISSLIPLTCHIFILSVVECNWMWFREIWRLWRQLHSSQNQRTFNTLTRWSF